MQGISDLGPVLWSYSNVGPDGARAGANVKGDRARAMGCLGPMMALGTGMIGTVSAKLVEGFGIEATIGLRILLGLACAVAGWTLTVVVMMWISQKASEAWSLHVARDGFTWQPQGAAGPTGKPTIVVFAALMKGTHNIVRNTVNGVYAGTQETLAFYDLTGRKVFERAHTYRDDIIGPDADAQTLRRLARDATAAGVAMQDVWGQPMILHTS